MGGLVKSSVVNMGLAVGVLTLGVAAAAGGIYVGETDDAPGAALIGFVLMIGAVMLALKIGRRKR